MPYQSAPTLLLDFTPGTTLNPGDPADWGTATLSGVSLSVADNELKRWLRDGNGDPEVGPLAGVGIPASASVGLTLNMDVFVIEPITLGANDDWLTGVVKPGEVVQAGLFAGLPLAYVGGESIDAGGGTDAIDVPRNSVLNVAATLRGFDELRFDPGTPAGGYAVAQFEVRGNGSPVAGVIGSPGTDVVSFVVETTAAHTLDLGNLQFVDFGGRFPSGSEVDDELVVAYFGRSGTVIAPASVKLRAIDAASATGSDLGDTFETVFSLAATTWNGGGGHDVFYPGAARESIRGGPGFDRVTYRSAAAVQIDLEDGQPEQGGPAAGDTIVEVERIETSRGDDRVRGSAADEEFSGDQGDDLLDGRAGNDRLEGGPGNDRLVGGPGDDELFGRFAAIVPPTADIDTAVFTGPRSAYQVQALSGRFDLMVTDLRPGAPDGTDRLRDVQLFEFSDRSYTLAELLTSNPVPSTVRIDAARSTLAVAEGTPPGGPGFFSVTLARGGSDIDSPLEVRWKLVAGTAAADDVGLALDTEYMAVISSGSLATTISFPATADNRIERNETLGFEIVSTSLGSVDGSRSATLTIQEDDALLLGVQAAASVAEGSPWALRAQSVNDPAGLVPITSWLVDWGDGTPAQRYWPQQMAAGAVSHVYADGDRPAGTPRIATVEARDASDQALASALQPVTVTDVAPALALRAERFLISGKQLNLVVDGYTDPGDDPLQGARVVWGDGTPDVALPSVPAVRGHVYDGLGSFALQLFASNDDGEQLAAEQLVHVAAWGGRLPGQTIQTPRAATAAWTGTLLDFSHDDDLSRVTRGGDDWAPVSLSWVRGSRFDGGDLYLLGGAPLLGVSGGQVGTERGRTETRGETIVYQQVDGSEALRIRLKPALGEHANALVLDLALFLRGEEPGVNESMRVQLFDGARLVGESTHVASTLGGYQRLMIDSGSPFDSVVLSAGAYDALGNFVYGAMADDQGRFLPAPAGIGSDFMVQAVVLLDTPGPVALVGVPAFPG